MHADAWGALGTWATVLVAAAAAFFALRQVEEARKTRERVAQPEVIVFVDHHQIRGYVDLVIKNFGQTTAYNIRITLPDLQLTPYTSQITGQEVKTLVIPKSIAVLAPGQEWRTVWDSAARREKYKGELRDDYGGVVEFDDSIEPNRRTYRNPIALNIKMFWNTTYIQPSGSNPSIQNALYDISKTLKRYGEEHEGIWVYTDTGDAEREYHRTLAGYNQEQHDQTMRDMGVYRDASLGDGHTVSDGTDSRDG